jgi:hypothetical protein
MSGQLSDVGETHAPETLFACSQWTGIDNTTANAILAAIELPTSRNGAPAIMGASRHRPFPQANFSIGVPDGLPPESGPATGDGVRHELQYMCLGIKSLIM